ncbi:MAG: helix-turn-helix transcriptional regulator [Kiritimatiellae bacterium]|jgi:transcriptional regulator with XRE-family HTH domain|nr:helix-turn-helix transcriptional regulator [Kiritimatiellia bacterium]
MMNTPQLRQWITGQLHARNWTRADLARETHTSESTWTRVFQGKTKCLQPQTAVRTSELFNCSLYELERISRGIVEANESVREIEPKYGDKWDRLVRWLSAQPKPVQDAVIAIAVSHGWKE